MPCRPAIRSMYKALNDGAEIFGRSHPFFAAQVNVKVPGNAKYLAILNTEGRMLISHAIDF